MHPAPIVAFPMCSELTNNCVSSWHIKLVSWMESHVLIVCNGVVDLNPVSTRDLYPIIRRFNSCQSLSFGERSRRLPRVSVGAVANWPRVSVGAVADWLLLKTNAPDYRRHNRSNKLASLIGLARMFTRLILVRLCHTVSYDKIGHESLM